MKIGATYSHLNGQEFLLVHLPKVWDEVESTIDIVDANRCRTKVSREKTRRGQMLYSPVELNRAFATEFKRRGWKEHRQTFWTAKDPKLVRRIYGRSEAEQKRAIEQAGEEPIMSYNQTDFVKERVAVEVQFGKYAFVAHDLFVKHVGLFVSGAIDVGIEVLPMKSLERQMSSGVPYYERDLLNIIRQGRGTPTVPLVLIGLVP